ncbi:MAG TPA: hypothetical protein VN663_14335 [Ramlibacter sp.]|nr:hypothetical protein [Ramlibacter sp.]
MGSLIFWATWLAIFCFFALTTRQQRRAWLSTFWCLACISLTGSMLSGLLTQGYITLA